MYGQPLKFAGLTIAISVVAGAFFAAFSARGDDFLYRFLGFAAFLASLLLGFVAGEHVDYVSRREKNRMRNLAALLALGTAGIVLAYWVGSIASPVFGRSENRVLFPGLFTLGMVGGFLGARRN